MGDSAFQFIGQMVVAGGGGALIAVLLSQWLGKKWIESKFAERLEQLKHEQSVVVARLKVEVDSMLSGALKFQERDFTVLPGVWEKLYQATVHVNWLTSNIRETVNVARMEDFQFNEWVGTLNFSDMHKGELLRSQPEDRQQLFEQLDLIYQISDVRKILGAYQQYLEGNAIFFPLDLKAKLKEIESALWGQIVDRESRKQMQAWGIEHDPATQFERVIPPLRDEIEVMIRSRLESHLNAFKAKVAA